MHKSNKERKIKVICPVCNYIFSITEKEICYSIWGKEYYVACRNPAYNPLGYKKLHCNGYIPLDPLVFADSTDASPTPTDLTDDKKEWLKRRTT